MRQSAGVNRIAVIVVALLVTAASVFAQGGAETKDGEVNIKIWSQSYWLRMAQLGLVEVAPNVPVKDAVYTNSEIDVPGVSTEDSPDVPVTNDSNTTQSENSIFIHPLDINTVLNSNNSTTWPVSMLYGADALYSNDGGQTWGGQIQGAGGFNSGDPAAAIGLNGWFYVGYIASNGGQGVAHSTNGGSTWTHVQAAFDPAGFMDKNHMWIDNSPTSSHEGNLYSAWTNFDGANDRDIELVRSTDSGLSWSAPINISSAVISGSHDQGVNIQTGPNGEVYVVFSIYDSWPSDETAIGFAKSTDGGATFAPATRIIQNIRGIRITRTSKNHRVNSFPSMAVDISGGPNNGTIYIVWTNIGVPGVNVGPDIDVYMVKSTDEGATWSTPARVNQDSIGLGKEHYFPWITCDPVSGALSVIFYDDRNVSSTDCEVFVASSTDAGQSWLDFKVSDISFTPSPIPGLAGGYFGDYLGISARGGKVYPCWTDNRQGSGRAMTYVSPFALEKDSIPPDAVTDLAVADIGSNWITLTWTASGDDGDSGKASAYDIRYATTPIDEFNFDAATPVAAPPIPQEAGSTETFAVTGLGFNTTYFFALKVFDEWGNKSGLSNSPSDTTLGIPDIVVSPDTLIDSLLTGDTSTQIFTISNVGQDPSTLDFFISAAGVGFLFIDPPSGSIPANSSMNIQVTFDATGLFGGDYDASIEIFNNDPGEPVDTVFTFLHVTGAPDIALSDDTLDYDTVFIWASVVETLVVSNIGTDLLTVSNVSSDNTDYTVNITSFILNPGDSQTVEVTFSPTTTGPILGTLTISSDDPLDPVVTVALVGAGVEPPTMVVTPSLLDDSLFTGEDSTHVLTIANTNPIGSDLLWKINILPSVDSAKNTYILTLPDPNAEPPGDEEPPSHPFPVRTFPIQAELSDLAGVDILFDRSHGQSSSSSWSTIISDLVARGATVTENFSTITSELLTGYQVFWTLDSWTTWSPSELSAVAGWVSSGGGFLLESDEVVSVNNSLLSTMSAGILYGIGGSTSGITTNIFEHETTMGVDSIYIGGPLARISSVVTPAGFLINDVTDVSNSAYSLVGAGRVVVMADENFGDWSIGTADNQLFANQVFDWLAVGVDWLFVDSSSGRVPADSSVDVQVTFDATGKWGGDYAANIFVSSNDPVNSLDTVAAHMHVTGAPDIAVSEDSLNYDNVFITDTVTDTLVVTNFGTDSLIVSDITTDNPDYSVDIASFTLAPLESQEVLVAFAPTTVGPLVGTLTIISNDPVDPIVTVALVGEGVEPPDISVTPESLSDSLFTGETSTKILTICNDSISDLVIYDISIEEVSALSVSGVKILPGKSFATYAGTSFRNQLVAASSDQAYNFDHQAFRDGINPGEIKLGDEMPYDLEILLLYGGGDPSEIQSLLQSYPDISVVDVFDVLSSTPTLDDLLAYHCAIVMNNLAFGDPVGLGDVLADYVDAGGGVVLTTASFVTGWEIAGRLVNEGYMPFNIGIGPIGPANLGSFDAGHPIMEGVTTAWGDLLVDLTLAPDAEWVAAWDTGIPFVATKGSTVAAVNIFVVDAGYWTGDIPLIIHNAAFWCSGGVSWLYVDIISDTIPGGSCIDVIVTFDATGLFGGDYEANIMISSNDPDEPVVTVPAHLYVTGAPDIVVSDDTLDYDTVFTEGVAVETLLVSNEGTDSLIVSNISSDNPDYTVDVTSFVLHPLESQPVEVTFAPTTTGSIFGTLTIINNDPNDSVVTVALIGVGVDPPVISVTPDSLDDSLFTGDTSIHVLTIFNDGESDLVFSISIEETDTSALSVGAAYGNDYDLVHLESRTDRTVSGGGWLSDGSASEQQPGKVTGSRFADHGLTIWEANGMDESTYTRLLNESLDRKSQDQNLLRSLGSQAMNSSAFPTFSSLLTIEDFDTTAVWPWSPWVTVFAGGSVISGCAHDGTQGILDPDWHYRTDVTLGSSGDKLSLWVKPGSGRAYMGFGATSEGAWSLVASPNTTELIIQRNLDYFYEDLAFVPQSWVTDTWYKLEVTFGDAGLVIGNLYGPDGTTLLNTVSAILSGFEPAGVAIRSFGNFCGDSFERGGTRWLSTSLTSGTVPPDSFIDIEVIFDATGLYGGDYYANIIIASNDPINSEVTVPAHLNVTGAPDIVLSDSTMDFGSVFVGGSKPDTLTVYNNGTDILSISNVWSDNSDYGVNTASFDLNPGDSQQVLVTFSPTVDGVITATLTIESNDPNDSVVTVALQGVGVLPPEISVAPESLFQHLVIGDTATQLLTISNTGFSELTFDVLIEEIGGAAPATWRYFADSEVPETSPSEEQGYGAKLPPDDDRSTLSLSEPLKKPTGISSNKAPVDYVPEWVKAPKITKAANSVLIIQDAAPWGNTANEQILAANGISYDMINSSGIGVVDFSNYQVVLVPSDQPTFFYQTVASFESKFNDYVSSGGILEFHASGWGWNGGDASLVTLPGGMSIGQSLANNNYLLDPSHPIVNGVSNPFTGTFASHASFSNIALGTAEIVEDEFGDTNLVEYAYGNGIVVASGQTLEYGYNVGEEAGTILMNMIPYVYELQVGPGWITAAPTSGTVPPDSSVVIEIFFDATDLYDCDYPANILISNNDPDPNDSLVTVPAHLRVTGAPEPAAVIDPDPMYVFQAYTVDPDTAMVYVGDFVDGHSASDIDPSTLLINDSIPVFSTSAPLPHPEFYCDVMEISFSIRDFILGYGPLYDTTEQVYTVSGQFYDSSSFVVSGTVTMIGHISGDLNNDGVVNIADFTYFVDYLFRGGPEPILLVTADVNGSCGPPDIADLTYLLNFLFRGGPAPLSCI